MEQELRRLPDGTYAGAMTDEHICGIFGCCGDWNRREVRIGALTVYVYAIDGITSGGDASEYVVKPLMQDAFGGTMDELYDRALHRTVYNSVAVPCGDLQSTAEKLVNGFTVVLFGQRAIAFETKTGEKRSPSAPEVENTVKGPKDAFTETVRTNTGLLRRHLRTPALRLYETVVGRRSLTNVTLVWIDGLTEPALVSRMQARLADIDIDGLLTPAAVEEYLTGSRPTAFPLLQYTERTDRFAQALLEGRAGLLVDGLPLGYLAPVDLGYLMTSAEDRGTDFVSASFLRVLRYAALLLGLLLPEVERMPHAEERRLFYVAMTRCKKKLFFVVDQSRPSRFMYELHDKICPNIFRGVKLPPQCPNCGEALSLRHNRNDPNRSFYGCTGFPNCRYTQQAK